jgi:16S rRNA (cytosine967-C5)-methyltransferase
MGKKIVKQAKPHRILLQAIVNALNTIFIDNKYADKVIEKTLKENPKFGSRDRRFIAETTYDIVRNYRLLGYLADSNNNFWDILGVYFIIRHLPMPDERDFKNLNEKTIIDKYKAIKDQKIVQSYPDWLWDLCETELGKDVWEKEAESIKRTSRSSIKCKYVKNKSCHFKTAFGRTRNRSRLFRRP